jgi:hypothetical protein
MTWAPAMSLNMIAVCWLLDGEAHLFIWEAFSDNEVLFNVNISQSRAWCGPDASADNF